MKLLENRSKDCNLGENIPLIKDESDDLFISNEIDSINSQISNIDYKKEETLIFYKPLCGNSCNIIKNFGCKRDCSFFNESIKKEIGMLLNKNSSELYNDLNRLFYKISGGEFDINFYDSLENNFEKIVEFFDKFFDGRIYDSDYLINSYELIHKFFIMNHGNIIEGNDIYDLSSSIIGKLDYFLINYAENLGYSDNDLLVLENMLGRFYVSHSHLKEIDFSSLESAINSFNFILERQIKGINIIFKTKFGGNPEYLDAAMNVFIVNYSYIYGQFLNYLKENGLGLENIKHDYFKFNEKNLSIEDRKEKLFDYFLDLLKEDSYNKELGNIDFKETDDILYSFLENSDHEGYNSVIILEIIHHVLSLFPEKKKTLDVVLKFGEKLLLNDNYPDHIYNSMKLRTLNLILKRIFDKNILDEKILDFLEKVEENIDLKGSSMIAEYARIGLPVAGIYSNFYSKYKTEILSLDDEIDLIIKNIKSSVQDNSSILDDEIGKKELLEKKIENVKNKSIEYLSNYSKLYLDSNVGILRDDSIERSKKIIKNLFLSNFSFDFDNDEVFNELYDKDEKILFLEKESDLINGINDISRSILKNDFNFNKIDVYLDRVSKIFFKNICDIKIFLKEDFVETERYDNKKIDLGNGYFLIFNINKKFSDLFEVLFNERVSLIYEIKDILSEFIENNKKYFFNDVTGLKNGNNYNSEISKIEKQNIDGAIISIEFSNFYNLNSQSNQKSRDIIKNKILQNSDFYKNLKIEGFDDFEIYHMNNNKFVLLFKGEGINHIEIVGKIKEQVKGKDLLQVSVSGFSGKLDSSSLDKCGKGEIKTNEELDPDVYEELQDVIENRKKDILFFLQPIVDHSGNIVKYEALTRIRKKDGGMLLPYQFFPILEKESFSYYKFTKLQLERGFELSKKYNINLSINLSTQDLSSSGEMLLNDCIDLINLYGKEIASKITLEILEDEYFNESIYGILKKLKEMGFRLAIDDFGAGDSNYERLIDFSEYVDILKIDGNLIKNLVLIEDKDGKNIQNTDGLDDSDYLVKENKKNKIIVKNIISMAHELGLEIISEFIENKYIVETLNEIGNNYMQGYFLGKPFNSEEKFN